MGRRKIEMKYITNRKKRSDAQCKRLRGLFAKAAQFQTLVGAQVFVQIKLEDGNTKQYKPQNVDTWLQIGDQDSIPDLEMENQVGSEQRVTEDDGGQTSNLEDVDDLTGSCAIPLQLGTELPGLGNQGIKSQNLGEKTAEADSAPARVTQPLDHPDEARSIEDPAPLPTLRLHLEPIVDALRAAIPGTADNPVDLETPESVEGTSNPNAQVDSSVTDMTEWLDWPSELSCGYVLPPEFPGV